jgi:hypothetical protein
VSSDADADIARLLPRLQQAYAEQRERQVTPAKAMDAAIAAVTDRYDDVVNYIFNDSAADTFHEFDLDDLAESLDLKEKRKFVRDDFESRYKLARQEAALAAEEAEFEAELRADAERTERARDALTKLQELLEGADVAEGLALMSGTFSDLQVAAMANVAYFAKVRSAIPDLAVDEDAASDLNDYCNFGLQACELVIDGRPGWGDRLKGKPNRQRFAHLMDASEESLASALERLEEISDGG